MQIKENPNSDQIEGGKAKMEIPKPEYKKTQVISDNVALLLVKQISREMYNHNLYSTFSDYFKLLGLNSLEDYFNGRAKEELVHHQWIVDYLKECSIPFAYPQIDEIEVEITDNLYPFQKTIDAEIETTEWINKIAEEALTKKDWQTFFWLEKLINEQTEEEGLSLKVFQLASEDCDWITKGDAIQSFYENK